MYGFANSLKEAIYLLLYTTHNVKLKHDDDNIPIYTYIFILRKVFFLFLKPETTAETIHFR